jgi:L-ribulose-5-phosphate 4-epimerase
MMEISEAKKQGIETVKVLIAKGIISRKWGNVSCRVDDNNFVITPIGADCQSLKSEDISLINIEKPNCSKDILSSLEIGLHTEVYKTYPSVNVVIHTHQEFASVIGSCGLSSIKVDDKYKTLAEKVVCASYGLPGTEELSRKTAITLKKTNGNAIILKNHGALCFGSGEEIAIKSAIELEEACKEHLKEEYLKQSGEEVFNEAAMYSYALSRESKNKAKIPFGSVRRIYDANRDRRGFTLYDEKSKHVIRNQITKSTHPEEAMIYRAIFKNIAGVNNIIVNYSKSVIALIHLNKPIRPLLDDFAKLVGTKVNIEGDNPFEIVGDLKNASVVFLRGIGALCCGRTKEDANAVSMAVEKNCKAYIGTFLLGKAQPLSSYEAFKMRRIYLKNNLNRLKKVINFKK